MKKSDLLRPSFDLYGDSVARSVQITSLDRQQPFHHRLVIAPDIRQPLNPGEIRIGMLAMTIHPADVLQINGAYGVTPSLPYTPGHEGVAVVLETAGDVKDLTVGDVVVPMAPGGTWRDERVVGSRQVTSVDGDVDILQCAMLSANPMTAWVLLNALIELQPDACLVQNAANSAVGQCVRQLSAALGLRLINVVRRLDAVDQQHLGDEYWIVDDGMAAEEFAAKVSQIADGRPLPLALDAIAGSATAKLGASVSVGGKVVVYGLLSQQPSQVAPNDLVFRGVIVQGFWLASWFADSHNRATAKTVLPRLLSLLADGKLSMSVAATYDLQEVGQALIHADQPHRTGKVLLTGAWLERLLRN